MMMVSLNYWAILVAAVVNMVIGMVYYSPMAFGGLYGKLMGKKSTDMKMKGYEFPVQFVASLVLVYVLAHFLDIHHRSLPYAKRRDLRLSQYLDVFPFFLRNQSLDGACPDV